MGNRVFDERISSFLKNKMDIYKEQDGENSKSYLGLARQYVKNSEENKAGEEKNEKHYEAGLEINNGDNYVYGVERLYKHSIVIEPTLVCAAHCRYCLRRNYAMHTMTEDQLTIAAKYCGTVKEINEVLITGGDPLLIPRRIEFFIKRLLENAPNVKIIRIATRLFTQDPSRLDESVLSLLRYRERVRIEIATQINHPAEIFPETKEAFFKFHNQGVKIYSQNVLLKGVNDDLDTLSELYELMRENDIEAHYLFHCVPLYNAHYLRTSVKKGIKLARKLTNSGIISGRVKPMFAAMTDIGKITFYDGTILEKKGNLLLLKSGYKVKDRTRWNPSWKLPSTSIVDDDGYLLIWYQDGKD